MTSAGADEVSSGLEQTVRDLPLSTLLLCRRMACIGARRQLLRVDWLTVLIGADRVLDGVYSGNVTADGGSPAPYSPPGGPYASSGPSLPPPPAFGSSGGRRPRSAGVAVALGGVAVVVAVAALVVALVRGGASTPSTPVARSTTQSTAMAGADTSAADKALCEAVGPLMTESNKEANDWASSGEQGTPGSDAGLPKFVADTKDWVRRAQAVVDEHPDVGPFFRRALQRYIDDLSLYVINVRPGPKQIYDSAAWADSLVAYGGAKSICRDLGIGW